VLFFGGSVSVLR